MPDKIRKTQETRSMTTLKFAKKLNLKRWLEGRYPLEDMKKSRHT